MSEQSQRAALTVTESEGHRLVARVGRSPYLLARGVEVYTVPALEPLVMGDGTKLAAVTVMVRAETDFACGLGVGFVVVTSEGLV